MTRDEQPHVINLGIVIPEYQKLRIPTESLTIEEIEKVVNILEKYTNNDLSTKENAEPFIFEIRTEKLKEFEVELKKINNIKTTIFKNDFKDQVGLHTGLALINMVIREEVASFNSIKHSKM